MAISYTKEQQKVIDTRGKDLLVSAAAGSGKTAVLVARILGRIMDETSPIDIDRLLIVTFTKAAASEMRERIIRAINAELLKNPTNEQLQKQATYIHKAQITTIDSFCKYLISNHFEDIGIDPDLRVADEAETKLLKQDVMAEMMEQLHTEAKESFLRCLECFAVGRNEENFEKRIFDLYEFAMSYPWPKQWLNECLERYQCESKEEFFALSFMEELLADVKVQLTEAERMLTEALVLCNEADGPYMYGELFEQEKTMIEALTACSGYEELYEKLSGVSFARLSSKKDASVNSEKREAAKNLRNSVKDILKDIQEEYFSVSPQRAYEDFVGCKENAEVLVGATLLFMEQFAAAKAEKKIMDFHDMEHLALQILYEEDENGEKVPSMTALAYRDYFEEIMIDEYQDSNLVQELLLSSMIRTEDGRRNSFMVGDVKQSIYKFRLARPEIFMEKYALFTEEGQQVRIDLHKNFRSRSEVIESVNDVFGQVMDASLGGITYDDGAKLYLGAQYPQHKACKSELLIFEKEDESQQDEITANESGENEATENESKETDLQENGAQENVLQENATQKNEEVKRKIDAKEGEAEMVALRIQSLIGQMDVTDSESGELRKAGYGDIVILLRSISGQGEVFKKALEERGIPVHIPVATAYFSAIEIRQILDYLRVLGNPYRDVSLCGLLKSPFFGYTDEELAWIKGGLAKEERKLYFYEAMKRYVADEQQKDILSMSDVSDMTDVPDMTEVSEAKRNFISKIKATLQTLEENRQKAIYLSVHDLILELMAQGRYMEYQSALPGGEKRKSNLEMLLQKAIDFEKTSYHGLFNFVRYMEQLEKYEVDFAQPGQADETVDAVRIMTIHKSKGLEFPICFVSGLSKRYNMQSAAGAVLTDMDLGIAMDYLNPTARIKVPTVYKRYVANKLRKDNIAEELRVLYVALTRAKEKLIMTANVKSMESALKSYRTLTGGEMLPYSVRMNFSNNLACVLAAYSNLNRLEELCQVVHSQDLEKVSFLTHTKREVRKEQLLHQLEEEGEALYKVLQQKFAYEYPHKALSKLYTKTSVSELKKAAMEEREETHVVFETDDPKIEYLPKYLRAKEQAGGAQRGSAYHKLLELFDYAKYEELPQEQHLFEIKSDMKEFVKQGFLSEEFYSLIYPNKIAAFLKSKTAKRMGVSEKEQGLFKERPFVMQVSASELGKEYPKEEGVLIQGIIDVYFKEGDELVLLDYKTDRVDTAEELINRYRAQLDLYARALEQLTGKKVKEKLIYSFALEEEISL